MTHLLGLNIREKTDTQNPLACGDSIGLWSVVVKQVRYILNEILSPVTEFPSYIVVFVDL